MSLRRDDLGFARSPYWDLHPKGLSNYRTLFSKELFGLFSLFGPQIYGFTTFRYFLGDLRPSGYLFINASIWKARAGPFSPPSPEVKKPPGRACSMGLGVLLVTTAQAHSSSLRAESPEHSFLSPGSIFHVDRGLDIVV